MNIKRFLSGMILFPIFAIIIVFGNKYLVDVFISIIAIMSLHEFYKAFKNKADPIQWIRICFSRFNLFYTFYSKCICFTKYNFDNIGKYISIVYTDSGYKYEKEY